MAIKRWDPFRGIITLQEAMDLLMEESAFESLDESGEVSSVRDVNAHSPGVPAAPASAPRGTALRSTAVLAFTARHKSRAGHQTDKGELP